LKISYKKLVICTKKTFRKIGLSSWLGLRHAIFHSRRTELFVLAMCTDTWLTYDKVAFAGLIGYYCGSSEN